MPSEAPALIDEIWSAITARGRGVAFGLQAQGHLTTIERMLGEGRDWKEIGQAIGWCPETAQRHYEWHRNRGI